MKRHVEMCYSVEVDGKHLALSGGTGYIMFSTTKMAREFKKELRHHIKAKTKVVAVRVTWEWE